MDRKSDPATRSHPRPWLSSRPSATACRDAPGQASQRLEICLWESPNHPILQPQGLATPISWLSDRPKDGPDCLPTASNGNLSFPDSDSHLGLWRMVL